MRNGFTLSELMIALALMGVIAIFTVPKVLNSVSISGYNANAKATAMMIQAAYADYQQENQPTGSTSFADITPYMHFIRVDTTTPIDDWYTGGQFGCDATTPCLLLQNGGRLLYEQYSFNNTASTNMIDFQFDPDGKYGGTTNGPGKSVPFYLYFDGQITSKGNARANSYFGGGGPYGPNAAYDPPWFNWSN